MMRKVTARWGLAVLLALITGTVLWAAGEHKHENSAMGQSVTLQGEVLDMACYMSHEGKGEKHAKCAQSCIDGGAPAGLLTDNGNVYLLVENHKSKGSYEMAKKMAGKQVKVSGTMYNRGGVQALVLASVEKAK